jgi:hypothetical protein
MSLQAGRGAAGKPRLACSGAWVELGLVALLLLAAAFFRLYRIDSVPAGLTPDLAFNGMDARDVLAGHLPVFFPRNSGREALFIYLQTLVLAGAGFRLLSFTFAGAAVGMLGVATAYRLWKALFGWRAGLLAALFLAVSFWDVTSNRTGFRVNSMLPLLNVTVYLLWRTLHTGRRGYAVYGGVALGLTLYTYTAARLIPLLVVACCACTWTVSRKRLCQLALLAGSSALVFAPAGLYFARHPQEFLMRTQGVSAIAPHAGAKGLGSAILGTLGMFFVRGDANPAWNLIGRPVFEPWQAALFLFGIVLAMWRSRTEAAPRWALCWLLMMLLPAALSLDVPDSQRALGAAPAVFLFPALALEAAGLWAFRRRLGSLVPGLAAAAVASAGTFGAYFGTWAHNPDVYGGTDVSRLHLAQFVADRPETRIYFADSDITGHVVRMFVPSTDQDGWMPEASAAIPIPSRLEGDTLYVSTTDAALKDLVPKWLPGVRTWPHPDNPLDKPDFFAFTWDRVSAEEFLGRLTPAGRPLANDFEIVSYGSLPAKGPGLRMTVVWRPIHASGPYDMYVHLLDKSGRTVGQSDRLVWPVRDFREAHEGLGPPQRGYFDEGSETDDWLLTEHSIQAPPGTYTAEIGAAHRDPANPDAVTSGIGSIAVPVVIEAL